MDLRRPGSVAGFVVLERIGRGGRTKEQVIDGPQEQVGGFIGREFDPVRQRRPVAERRGREQPPWQLRGRDSAQRFAAGLVVPRVATGIGDHAALARVRRLGDQGEAAIRERRPRRQHVPGAQGHRGGADAKRRTRTFAEGKCPHAVKIHAELLDAAKNGDPRFFVAGRPAPGAVGREEADVDAHRRGVDDEQRRVRGEEIAQA